MLRSDIWRTAVRLHADLRERLKEACLKAIGVDAAERRPGCRVRFYFPTCAYELGTE